MINHGLKDISIETEYRSSENDIINEFYIPMLKESISYKRAVGFFSSSSLKEISKGLKYFIKNNGKIQIVTSPNLSEEDVEAIKKGYELRDKIIENCLLKELKEPETEKEKEELKILADLISENILDIKIAFIKNENNIGIYHEKLGIFEDEKKEKVVFTGSLNETLTAMTLNYETIDVFTSWNDCKRVEKKERAFNSIWNNKEKNIEVLEFPKLKNEIIRRYQYKKSDLSFFSFEENSDNNIYEINEEVNLLNENEPEFPDKFILYDYQEDAVKKWEEKKFCGIFHMATGTGKTYTGLSALKKLYDFQNGKLASVIVCPYQHLVEQWVEDIEKFNIKPIIGYSASKQKNWKRKLTNSIELKNLGIKGKEFFCFICTNTTFSSKFVQNELSKIKDDLFLLVDEAHNFGSNRLKKLMDNKYKFRLALSATLDRFGDEEGTEALYNFFGEKCIDYTLERAINEGKLTPYKYFPIIINFTEEERESYNSYTDEMAENIIQDEKGNIRLNERGKFLAIQRARIIAGAKNKLNILKEKILPYKKEKYILVYCGATNVLRENSDSSETDENDIRQIDKVIRILGNELNMRVSPFTSNESINEREIIKEEFKKGEYLQALVAIKCLDEGVNIPNIKTAFILASTTNSKEYIQRRGRVLRLAKNKGLAEIYDFITLPRDLETVPYTDPYLIKKEKGLVKRELARIQEFGRLALNKYESDLLINKLKISYGIYDNENLMEENYE